MKQTICILLILLGLTGVASSAEPEKIKVSKSDKIELLKAQAELLNAQLKRESLIKQIDIEIAMRQSGLNSIANKIAEENKIVDRSAWSFDADWDLVKKESKDGESNK